MKESYLKPRNTIKRKAKLKVGTEVPVIRYEHVVEGKRHFLLIMEFQVKRKLVED